MKHSSSFSHGFALVEVLVASAIILLFTVSLSGAYALYIRTAFTNLHKVQATLLSEEGVEAVKLLRDASWTTNIAPLSGGVSYYLVFSNGVWSATTTPMLVDGTFDRSFTLGHVSRDASSDITTSGGTIDPNTRLINVSVSWQDNGATTTKSLSAYVTNLFVN